MSWPIILTRDQSEAVRQAMTDFSETLTGEARAIYAVVLHQMDKGIALDHEEQELVRSALLASCRAGAGQHAETAYFRLYGRWVCDPPWWATVEKPRRGRPPKEHLTDG